MNGWVGYGCLLVMDAVYRGLLGMCCARKSWFEIAYYLHLSLSLSPTLLSLPVEEISRANDHSNKLTIYINDAYIGHLFALIVELYTYIPQKKKELPMSSMNR